MPMSASSGGDPGLANIPAGIDPASVVWESTVPKEWWRNAHQKAPGPLEFSNADGRFSHPTLPFKTLYLGSDEVTCFWESGLGRNLIRRFMNDRTIPAEDLVSRIEYIISLNPARLRFFHANDLRDVKFADLKKQTIVVFEPVDNARFGRQNGRRAERVRIAE